MTEEINKPVQRHDRDFGPLVTKARDTHHDETVRAIKEYLKRPILAKEANGAVPLHGDALRKHANLDAVPEHPFARQLREIREARGE